MFTEDDLLYVDVIIPLSLPNLFTYSIPADQAEFLIPGSRVVVSFGKRRLYTAVVAHVHDQKPSEYRAKPVLDIIDEDPIVTLQQLAFWKWLAHYYMTTIGDVMNAALPVGFKMNSETRVFLNKKIDLDLIDTSSDEDLIIQALNAQEELSIKAIESIFDKKNVYSLIKKMFDNGIIFMEEVLLDSYKPKTAQQLNLSPLFSTPDGRKSLFDLVARAPKQEEALLAFVHLTRKQAIILKPELTKMGFSSAIIKALIEKEILLEETIELDRISIDATNLTQIPTLTSAQQIVFENIQKSWTKFPVQLLHGVTSSGKTLVYFHIIQQVLEEEGQTLYLLPEIALTGQMVSRLRACFGELVGVYHSRYSANERVEIWKKVADQTYKVIIGARSALLLPFSNLKLMVIDEEHDASFKQREPAPRYNARDAAIWQANQCKANVLLGSATPSFESLYNVQLGRYGYHELTERYEHIALPTIEVLDISKHSKITQGLTHFSQPLITAIKTALSNDNQVILFKNRRGYAPLMVCETCGDIPYCKNCDVSLTYHKHSDQLICHYCGYRKRVKGDCASCGSYTMTSQGFGTQKIEDELKLLFPNTKIGRMDHDAVKGKDGHQRVINQFERKEFNILIGTQMVTKGLDFGSVSLVGVLSADNLLHFPDFRSSERALQLLLQVAGRAGRKGKAGHVLIQTMDPNHPIFSYLKHHNYNDLYHREIVERKQFSYPPFKRFIYIFIKDIKQTRVIEAAALVKNNLKPMTGVEYYDPVAPPISRVRNQYILQIIVKIDKKQYLLEAAKKTIHNSFELLKQKGFRSTTTFADVDPY